MITLKQNAARHLRQLAGHIWDLWNLSEVRYLSSYDLAVITIVGKIDALANRLDPEL